MHDLDLLAVEIETLWAHDARGRLLHDLDTAAGPAPHLALGVTRGGYRLALGILVSELLEAGLRETLDALPAPPTPASEPPALSPCAAILQAALGPVVAGSGPSYVIDAAPRPEAPRLAAGLALLTSDRPREAAALPVPETWPPMEWTALVAGELGPWALLARGGVAVSICHSARWAAGGAEAGVWTHPAHRGQGLAATVTARWADLARSLGRIPFYSTWAENLSSQRVAARLGARNIGWIWTLRPSPPT